MECHTSSHLNRLPIMQRLQLGAILSSPFATCNPAMLQHT